MQGLVIGGDPVCMELEDGLFRSQDVWTTSKIRRGSRSILQFVHKHCSIGCSPQISFLHVLDALANVELGRGGCAADGAGVGVEQIEQRVSWYFPAQATYIFIFSDLLGYEQLKDNQRQRRQTGDR